MKSIFISGGSGFVGINLIDFLSKEFSFINYKKGDTLKIHQNIVIHLAGKAHDLKRVSSPDEYYNVNTELTQRVFDEFLASDARIFITLSSVKAVADEVDNELTEESTPNPKTHYGKSKLLAEKYIFSKQIPKDKRVYILRPCMIHGRGNKGNLNLLYKLVSKGIPWPLGAFNNQRSFCSIDNLLFVIKEMIKREDIPSGIYNVADDLPLSTNEIIIFIAESQNRNSKIWKVSKKVINTFAKLGDILNLPLNTERLDKLTQNYIVSNRKLVTAIGKDLPLNSTDGMCKTLSSFN